MSVTEQNEKLVLSLYKTELGKNRYERIKELHRILTERKIKVSIEEISEILQKNGNYIA